MLQNTRRFIFVFLSLIFAVQMKDQHGVSHPIDVPVMMLEAAGSDLPWSSSALRHATGSGPTIAACASLGLKCFGMALREKAKT